MRPTWLAELLTLTRDEQATEDVHATKEVITLDWPALGNSLHDPTDSSSSPQVRCLPTTHLLGPCPERSWSRMREPASKPFRPHQQ
jgi:hypothetical protein